ncbi:extracellular catalytic domain type 1 short-chain-length polyhydroxyalkanoate depolymerase [Paracoccus salsus]|uniref:extracellular catalytic domain type 1 short-chain-length polyhydroxyalkanoate depolymerase n=1 Tax=Paracoccus salsus TaxID=2911061 RepID=UPI001F1D17CB|nr:PHB depolymerase family esterase [Paracoccus salsus]MCF3972129.1 PHB depolymerase family esterase [Paracoccus salsus]
MRSVFGPRNSRSRLRHGRKQASAISRVLGLLLGIAMPATGRSSTPKPRASTAVKPGTRKAGPETAAQVGRTGARRKAEGDPDPKTAPRGASFRLGVHRCGHGQRRYKIFTPSCASGTAKPLPLLVMLHGCGQTPDDFAKGTRMNALAEELGLIVVYPAQSREAHPNRCWNWYRPDDQNRGAGEPALIADLTRRVLENHPVDPSRVYVAGLSAGASAALVLADAYPDLFAAVGAHSGLPVGAARDHASAVIAMQQGNPGHRRTVAIPTITFSGSADRVVNPRNGRFVAIRALEPFPYLRQTERAGQVPGGHAYLRTTHRVGKGPSRVEQWLIKGSGHAWSGGAKAGRFTDPAGPDASREMLRFFLRHKLPSRGGRLA